MTYQCIFSVGLKQFPKMHGLLIQHQFQDSSLPKEGTIFHKNPPFKMRHYCLCIAQSIEIGPQ